VKYVVKITDIALEQYQKIKELEHSIIRNKINLLQEYAVNLPNIKPLKGPLKGLYRLRVGNYRIIFDIEKNIITIIAILHRKKSYK